MKKNTISMMVFFILAAGFYGIAIAHGWKAPEEFSKLENPVTENMEAVQSGQKLYGTFCNYCHGNNAEGGAHLALDIQPIPPDLKKRLKSHSDGDFFWKIRNGRGDMPSFEEDLNDNEIWEIISFIRSLIKQ